jgi:vitamin B12 transporter
MSALRILVFAVLLSAVAAAQQLTIKVIDPDSAAVAGAQVTLFRGDEQTPVAIQTTNGTGNVTFRQLESGDYRVQVLAPGFAVATSTLTDLQPEPAEIKLTVAGVGETVMVTATRSYMEAAESGAAVAFLDETQLENMQPISTAEALRFVPGAVVLGSGGRGSISSLFVRGGESRYNKIIIDGVSVNEPGGIFDFGAVPMHGVERLEFVRGAESTLYGSDAMSSVVQIFSANGRTLVPELRFGAEGGKLDTGRGYASLAGARGVADYNFFGEYFSTQGDGANDDYWNGMFGANVGVAVTDRAFLRFRMRHNNSRRGVQNAWWFNGEPMLPVDTDQFARQNNLLGSLDLLVNAGARWQHRVTLYGYDHKRRNVDDFVDPGRPFDDFFDATAKFRRLGANYQGEFTPRSWARTVFGYEFENERGTLRTDFDFFGPGFSLTRGQRRNHALFGQQTLTFARGSIVGGARWVHNEAFGNRAVPRIAVTVLPFKTDDELSNFRLRFAYAEGIKAPTFDESFGNGGTFPTLPNPDLKPERVRSLEGGFEQSFSAGRFALAGTYFHNTFLNSIDFKFDFVNGSQYVNVDRSVASGAEVEFRARIANGLSFTSAYVVTNTEIKKATFCDEFCDASLFGAGAPLLRRPKHSGSLLLNYSGSRWGGNFGGTFIGRRTDSDFSLLAVPIKHADGYARFDLGGWYAINRYMTAYANVENAFDAEFNDVLGYRGLPATYRAGMRFRIGGE